MTETIATYLMPVLLLLIAADTLLKLSMLPVKAIAVAAAVWGAVMWWLTDYFSEAEGLRNPASATGSDTMLVIFLECLIMLAFCFLEKSGGAQTVVRKALYLYPGVAFFIVPAYVARMLLGALPGMDFDALGLWSGALTAVAVGAGAFGLKLMTAPKSVGSSTLPAPAAVEALYVTATLTALTGVVMAGLQ